MESFLPSNDTITAFSQDVPWRAIEQQKRRFIEKLRELQATAQGDALPLEELSQAAGTRLSLMYDDSTRGNVILGHIGERSYIMGSFVSQRYRFGKPLLKTVVPYNLNPAVNHTNMEETDTPTTTLRAIGAEIELGLYHPDGSAPSDEEVLRYGEIYRNYAQKLGITPTVDREACQYQVEVHVAPGIGYSRARTSIESILQSLVFSSEQTGLYTAILPSYPILSDFHLTDDPKVHSAVDVMVEINAQFAEYGERQRSAKARYGINPAANVVELFRIQGCHIHLDVAGRSEALGLFTFFTMLKSATAIANSAVLKGGPFVNGTCDPEYLCTREYLRRTTVTGRYLPLPLSPHHIDGDMARYGALLQSERANSTARALLCESGLGVDISSMHNPIGRLRPDLGASKRICTVESTGMPVNISASRQAAVLADFEYTHVLVENYYRKHGTDLEPMMNDRVLWSLIGPLSDENFAQQHDNSDRHGTDIVLETASGQQMSLADFYEMKRKYMHRYLVDVPDISPREVDDVYMSLGRMLEPPSGRVAETVEQYIYDPTRRSTGNWGKILRDGFVEEGGTLGTPNPEAVLRVANRIHLALVKRYSS